MAEYPETSSKKQVSPLRTVELIIWLIIAAAVAWRPLITLFQDARFFFEFYYEFLFGLFVFLFPFLFRLIFGLYPFEYVRRVRQYKMSLEYFMKTEQKIVSEKRQFENNENYEHIPSEKEKNVYDELQTMLNYLKQSQDISEKIYTRSGVYLLLGCLIAFAGVLFFYFQSAYLHTTLADGTKPFDFSKTLIDYLPRLGTLIFVEAIAFFFLKQYRVTMEEYRYYEAIKRQRENQVAILKIARQYSEKEELIDKLIARCSFNDNPNKLGQNETTQLIEASKVSSQETDLIEKLIEIIKVAKK